jgi:hypothetical protein
MKKIISFSLLMTVLILNFYLGTTKVWASSTSITPGAIWHDTADGIIEAHGGGILKVGSTYYWYGEDHSNGYYFQNISVYSSTDLVNWKWCSYALSKQTSGDLGPNRVVERPKCIYNELTKKYVLFMHIDNSSYSEAKVGVATSDSPTGPFTYINSWNPNNHQSRDMTIFQDGTNAYLISLGEEGTSINKTDRIFPLSSDYLTAQPEICTLTNAGREGLSVFKAGSYYFIVGSTCSGWSPNQQAYTYSTSLASGWSSWNNLGDGYCFSSQSNYILPVTGSDTTSYIFMGDRWDSSNLSNSRYIWLPLNVNGSTLSMNWYNNWQVNTTTGAVTANNPNIDTTASYYLASKNSTNEVIDVKDTSLLNAASIVQNPNGNTTNQQWKFISLGNGIYNIVNVNSGKYLEVYNQSTADGGIIDQYTGNGGTNQKWKLQDAGMGYYYIVNVNSGKVFDVTGYSKSNGAAIDQWTNNGGANQKWRLEKSEQ